MTLRQPFLKVWAVSMFIALLWPGSVSIGITAEKGSGPLQAARDLRSAFVEVSKKVQPSVVSIRSERTVTVGPGEGFGEDFFKGTPFEDFFRRQPGPPQKRKQSGSS
jgi:S1-C subfamily serine protease